MAKIKGKRINSRSKGQSGEREVIDILQPVVDAVYKQCDQPAPKLERNTIQYASGGVDICGLPWFAPEVKFCMLWHVAQWWQQCLDQAGQTMEPVLFYRKNHGDWHIVMFGELPNGLRPLRVPVTVTMQTFLLWFRARLLRELTK